MWHQLRYQWMLLLISWCTRFWPYGRGPSWCRKDIDGFGLIGLFEGITQCLIGLEWSAGFCVMRRLSLRITQSLRPMTSRRTSFGGIRQIIFFPATVTFQNSHSVPWAYPYTHPYPESICFPWPPTSWYTFPWTGSKTTTWSTSTSISEQDQPTYQWLPLISIKSFFCAT